MTAMPRAPIRAALLDQMLSDPSGGIDEPAAIIFETVQGEGGLNTASPRWVRRMSEIARKHGALLIIDRRPGRLWPGRHLLLVRGHGRDA